MEKSEYEKAMDLLALRIRAGFPVIYIVSPEESRVLDNIVKIVRAIQAWDGTPKQLWQWTASPVGGGFKCFGALPQLADASHDVDWHKVEGLPTNPRIDQQFDRETPQDAFESITVEGGAHALQNSVCVFFDTHEWLCESVQSGQAVRPLRTAAERIRRHYNEHFNQKQYKTIIIVAPSTQHLAAELKADVTFLEFPLPEQRELRMVLENMIRDRRLKFPETIKPTDIKDILGPEGGNSVEAYKEMLLDAIANAGRGLTLQDYRLCLNIFAVNGGELSPEHIDKMHQKKAEAIKHVAGLEFTPRVDVKLGGLREIQDWIDIRRGAVMSSKVRSDYHLPAPKGVMLCGVAGGGKSQLAKYVASAYKVALLRLDVGALFGAYVGVSEENTRRALRLAEDLAPVVLWLDEIDKAFKGIGGPSGGAGDSGVAARVLGHFLTWLAEKKDTVFVVATANDYESLNTNFPELGRKGRFDDIMWVDLPGQQDRERIFEIYLEPHRELIQKAGQYDLKTLCQTLSSPANSEFMTGAEIENAVNDALFAAYDLDRKSGQRNQFTQQLILQRTQALKSRAMFAHQTPDSDKMIAQRQKAVSRGWIGARPQGRQ